VILLVECGALALGLAGGLVTISKPDSTIASDAGNMLVFAFMTLTYSFAARWAHDLPWRIAFLGFAIVAAINGAIATSGFTAGLHGTPNPLYYYFSWFHESASVVTASLTVSLLFYSSYQDLRRHTPRDWLHWLAAFCHALRQVLYCAIEFGFALIQSTYDWQRDS
jgi:hypothetical protein